MTTKTQEPGTRAVQVVEQGIEFNLDSFPEDRFNRLIPTQTIRMPSDLIVPVVQVVKLDIAHDTYDGADIKKGERALTKVGLRKVATAAGVSIIDERRTDDGSDPNVCEVTCTAEMTLPTGQRIRAIGIKRVDLGRQHWASTNQRKKYESFFQEHVASRAENRAIRSLLSLRSSYPNAELQRPFAVVTFAPNMDHPEVRSRILDAMAPTVQALYGPEDAKQLAAGDQVTEVEAAPDDDDVIEIETNGHARVDAHTGEVIGPASAPRPDAEPDWFGAAPAADEPELVARLQRVAEANRDKATPATSAQRQELQEALRGLKADEVGAVFAHLWDIGNLAAIESRHAQAILEVASAMGRDRLVAEWKTLAAELAAREAA